MKKESTIIEDNYSRNEDSVGNGIAILVQFIAALFAWLALTSNTSPLELLVLEDLLEA